MTTLCVRHPWSIERYARAWAISFVIHGLAVGLSIALVTSLHLPPDPNVFRWEVALVEPPNPASQTAPAESQPVPAASVSARSEKTSPPISPPARAVPVETQPIVKPVERVETVRAVERVPHVESVQTVQTSHPVTREAVKAVAPLSRDAISTTTQTVLQSTQVVSVPAQGTGTIVHEPVTTGPSAAGESHAVVREAHAVRETQAVRSALVTQERQVVTQNLPVTPAPGGDLGQVRVETRTFSRPLVEAKAIPAPTKPSEAAKVGVAKPAGPIGMPKNKPAFVNLEASTERSASFGWLTEAIKRSENQRRPVADHEGTTLFRITMRQDGRTVHLLDLSIVDSSGYPQVDRAAADLIRRSFPIELTETLANSQVRVDQPITIHTN